MLKFLKKYSGLIYVLVITVILTAILAGTDELSQIFATFRTLNPAWLAAAGGCILLYLFLRMATLKFYLARQGRRIGWLGAMGVTGAGQFYSAITPSASGGQPMQVLWLHRLNVPASLGIAATSAKFLGFQVAILGLGALMGLLFWRGEGSLAWLVVLGYAINAALIVAVALTVPKSRIVDRLIRWIIHLGKKLRIVKDEISAEETFRDAVKDYREALILLMKRPVDALAILGLSIAQVIAYMAVAVCLYHAFGLTEAGAAEILTVQLMLFIAAAFVPLPGAAGAQETGFCAFFRGIFPDAQLIAAMVCWRFFSYYLLLILGLIMMLASKLFSKKARLGIDK